MMRDAFYRSGYAVKMGEKGLMSDDDIETRMRARRGAFENETVTIVHDKLFDMNCPGSKTGRSIRRIVLRTR